MLFLSFFFSQKCRRFILKVIFYQTQMEQQKLPLSTTILWICQSFSNCHKKAIFCLLVNCFTVLFVLYDTQFTYDLDINSYSDFNNMNTIFITYFFVCFICEVLHSNERIHTVLFRWFLLDVQKLAKSWNHYSNLRMWDMLLSCLNLIYKPTNNPLKKPHVCQCAFKAARGQWDD